MAQSPKKLIREGYELFQEGKYLEAAEKFQEAGAADPNTFRPFFNEGDALYEADSLTCAAEQFELAQHRAGSKEDRAAALHNLGNTYLKKKEYDRSIEYFKQALLQNPHDEETRYNLAYAMAKRQQQESQQDQQKQDKENQEEEQEEQKQEQQNQEQQDQQQEQQEQPKPEQQEISQQQAEQLLKALEKEEQDLQKKMLQIKGTPEKREKDW